MIPLVILGLLVGIPVLLGLMLRVNVVLLFLSVAVGDMLVRFLADDTTLAVGAFVRSESLPMIVQLTLLLLPVLVSLLLLRKSIPRSKILLQVVPLLLVGLMSASLAIPLLPEALRGEITTLPVGELLAQSQDVVVGSAALLVLLLALKEYRHRDSKHGKHHK